MAPSASKQKRLAEKAAKSSASTGKNTPASTINGGSTPMTSLSANGSEENLADAQAEMRKLNLATDRSAVSLVVRVEKVVGKRRERGLVEWSGGIGRLVEIRCTMMWCWAVWDGVIGCERSWERGGRKVLVDQR
jgi:hypothetical protein